MKTKHTKKYAQQLADVHQKKHGGYASDFESGYLKAIEETAVTDLLEALEATKMLNLHLYEEGTMGNRVYKQINCAVNKANK